MTWQPDCLVVNLDPPAYAVPSERGVAVYLVTWLEDHFECDCPDYAARGQFRDCKHCAVLVAWLHREFPVQGETNDLVTDADVLYRAAEIVEARPYSNPPAGITHNVHGVFLRWLASRLESEPSTDGDMEQP